MERGQQQDSMNRGGYVSMKSSKRYSFVTIVIADSGRSHLMVCELYLSNCLCLFLLFNLVTITYLSNRRGYHYMFC